jgi:hypothetical protein
MKHFDIKDLIFVDESGANLRMSSVYARIEGGQRIKMPIPFERGPQFSMIGAISVNRVEAALYGEWATNGEIKSLAMIGGPSAIRTRDQRIKSPVRATISNSPQKINTIKSNDYV